MQLIEVNKTLKTISVRLLSVLILLPAMVQATTFSTMTSTIFNSNSSEACVQCHSSSLVGALARHSAPDGADFDIYTEAASRASTMDLYVSLAVPSGYMPMDPGAADFTDAADLNPTEMATVADWLADGAPFAAATATTTSITSQAKTSVSLRGTVDTNTLNSPATSDGSWYFEWGPGSTATYANGQVGNTVRNLTTSTTASHSLTGLECGNNYHYRAVAKNGNNTANGSKVNFSTSACTDPVIAGVTIVTDATDQTATEDADKVFMLTVTDDDPGSLQWSKTNGPNGASVALSSTTMTAFTGSATVTYRSAPAANYFGADSFTVTVNNMNTGTSRTITFNMTVSDDDNDSPIIAGTTTVNDNEDGVSGADGTPTAIAVSLSASDVDASPTYHWDITATNDGTPNISVNTGTNPTITYLPLGDDNGSPADTFTVRVCDGGSVGVGNCDSQVVTVNLTAQPDTPTAAADSGLIVVEGAASTLLSVIGNDIDPDSGEQATLVPNNDASLVVVTASTGLTITGVSGNAIEVAHDGREGDTNIQLTYKVRDTTGRISALATTVDLSILGTDDPPTGSDFTFGSTVDEASTVAIDVIAQSNDPESATMAVCTGSLSTPTYGSVSVNGSGNVEYVHDGTDVVAATTDTDSFTYQVNDANDPTCVAGNTSVANTVSLNLVAVNDPPVVVVDSITVAEGGTATILVGGNTSVVQNDTDEENGTGTGMTASIDSNPLYATVGGFTLNGDGTFSYEHDGSENFSTNFTYFVNDGTVDSAVSNTVSIAITNVNDQPSITSTAPTTALVLTEEATANVYQLTQSDTDDVAFTYSLGATGLVGDTAGGNMAISAGGLITWTPPRTGLFNQATAVVTVTVSDVDSSTAGANILSDVQMFSISTAPVDSDGDGVADYSDNCPSIPNAGQEDFDLDTSYTAVDPSGIPATGDVDPAGVDVNGFITGGNVCDEDGDADGIPTAIEDTISFLNPLDPSDAALDGDGDGISNLDEYNNDNTGATIDADSVGPTVTAPDDITIDSTGLLTVVDLGTPTGNDGNDGESTIFKAAVDLAAAVNCDDFESYEADIDAFRPGSYVVTWATCDSSENAGYDTQNVKVKPLVGLSAGQTVGEGQAVTIDVVLNGDAIAYPATVGYTISGTATSVDDHDAVDGVVTFNAKGDVGSITFNTIADVTTESDETIVFTLHSPNQIALSGNARHTVTLTEANIVPQALLSVTQPVAVSGKKKGNTVYTADGAVMVIANAVDGNGDTLSFDWSATDAMLRNAPSTVITANQIDFDPSELTVGSFYSVSITVSDGASSITAKKLLLVKAAEAVILTAVDSDGDGINDDDPLEGFGDDDADGIPNHRDNLSIPAHAIEDHTVDLENSVYIETDPGLKIAVGETAIATQATGVLIGLQDIIDFGGAGGVAVSNGATDYTFLSGLFSFEISGLTDAIESVNVVIPLQSTIQASSVYRKYNSSGWFDFVEDDKNIIRSAPGGDGTCPSAGSGQYKPGLIVGYLCVQLTIQDGGANDADGVRNYVVKDPGGLALAPVVAVEETPSQANGRVGSVSLWFMLFLTIAALITWRVRQRRAGR